MSQLRSSYTPEEVLRCKVNKKKKDKAFEEDAPKKYAYDIGDNVTNNLTPSSGSSVGKYEKFAQLEEQRKAWRKGGGRLLMSRVNCTDSVERVFDDLSTKMGAGSSALSEKDIDLSYLPDEFLDELHGVAEVHDALDTSRYHKGASANLPDGSENRLSLFIDIDETIVHVTPGKLESLPPDAYFILRAPSNGGKAEDGSLSFVLDSGLRDRTAFVPDTDSSELFLYAYFRPMLKDVLRDLRLSGQFEIIAFTSALDTYADPILDAIEAGEKLFDHRLYRQHCCTVRKGAELNGSVLKVGSQTDTLSSAAQINYVKDLSSIIYNRNLARCVLVDNSPVSMAAQLENGVYVRPFYGDAEDDELKLLHRMLLHIRVLPDVRMALHSGLINVAWRKFIGSLRVQNEMNTNGDQKTSAVVRNSSEQFRGSGSAEDACSAIVTSVNKNGKTEDVVHTEKQSFAHEYEHYTCSLRDASGDSCSSIFSTASVVTSACKPVVANVTCTNVRKDDASIASGISGMRDGSGESGIDNSRGASSASCTSSSKSESSVTHETNGTRLNSASNEETYGEAIHADLHTKGNNLVGWEYTKTSEVFSSDEDNNYHELVEATGKLTPRDPREVEKPVGNDPPFEYASCAAAGSAVDHGATAAEAVELNRKKYTKSSKQAKYLTQTQQRNRKQAPSNNERLLLIAETRPKNNAKLNAVGTTLSGKSTAPRVRKSLPSLRVAPSNRSERRKEATFSNRSKHKDGTTQIEMLGREGAQKTVPIGDEFQMLGHLENRRMEQVIKEANSRPRRAFDPAVQQRSSQRQPVTLHGLPSLHAPSLVVECRSSTPRFDCDSRIGATINLPSDYRCASKISSSTKKQIIPESTFKSPPLYTATAFQEASEQYRNVGLFRHESPPHQRSSLNIHEFPRMHFKDRNISSVGKGISNRTDPSKIILQIPPLTHLQQHVQNLPVQSSDGYQTYRNDRNPGIMVRKAELTRSTEALVTPRNIQYTNPNQGVPHAYYAQLQRSISRISRNTSECGDAAMRMGMGVHAFQTYVQPAISPEQLIMRRAITPLRKNIGNKKWIMGFSAADLKMCSALDHSTFKAANTARSQCPQYNAGNMRMPHIGVHSPRQAIEHRQTLPKHLAGFENISNCGNPNSFFQQIPQSKGIMKMHFNPNAESASFQMANSTLLNSMI